MTSPLEQKASSKKEDYLWVYPKEDPTWKEAIIKEFKVHPVIAQILVSRGFSSIEEIHEYLYAKLPDLHDPFLLEQMPQAVARITQAIENKESILIYGDNDVDGMTGTALLTEFLRFLGANVFFYISSRSMLRQSLIVEALEYALKNQCKLLITVDCGITAALEIAKVRARDVDVIITDHHEPTDTIPHCVATLNPKLLNSSYPNRDLTGVGVAFKLAHALTKQWVAEGRISEKKVDLKRYLDLVALGTVSDMGALKGENRILVRYGLKQLNRTKRIGLSKLIKSSEIGEVIGELTTFSIASKIAPKLNSLGRIDKPQKGVELLLARNAALAEKMAEELELNNSERQKIERVMTQEAEAMLVADPSIVEEKAILLSSDKWHPGIIAILSTRIAKQYNRPAAVIAIDQGIGKGSLRSFMQFPLLTFLKKNSDLLINFGGHDFAAGLAIKETDIPEFQRRWIKAAKDTLSENDVASKLHLDAAVNFADLTFDFMESIKLLEPFGNENPPPVLFCEAKQAWPPKLIGKTDLKLYLEQKERILEGIAFKRASASPFLRKRHLLLRVAFTPQINDFQGPSIHLLIKDFQIQN